MTTREFELLDAINREGLSNEQWGLWKFKTDTDSATQFGTEIPFPLLEGVSYLAIWLSQDKEIYNFIDKVVERHHCDVYDVLYDNTDFYLYQLD